MSKGRNATQIPGGSHLQGHTPVAGDMPWGPGRWQVARLALARTQPSSRRMEPRAKLAQELIGAAPAWGSGELLQVWAKVHGWAGLAQP